MLEKETKLKQNQGFNYRKKVIGILTLTASHYSAAEISHYLKLSFSQLETLFKQNDRLPLPYDWSDYVNHPEKRKEFYQVKRQTTSRKQKDLVKQINKDDDSEDE